MRRALGHCNRNTAGITVDGMDFSGAAAHSILAQISGELAGTAPNVQSILTSLTRSLSHIRSGTWFAVLLDPDPSTSHVVVAGDSDGSMSAYVDGFVKTLAGPTGTPTLTLSQQVVETSDPVLILSVPFTDFISLLSPAGQSYFSSHPPPHALDAVGVLVVPMRAGGAIIGTLGIFDWQQQPALSEDDVVRVQLVADHVALALENARLQTAVSDQAERVAVIGAIALAIRVGQDLPLTLRVVVEQVTARLNVDAADVLLMTEQGNELYVAASAGFHTSSIPNYRLPAGAGDQRVIGTPIPKLGDLEMEILRQIAEGHTNREIAVKVHRSENTIKFHVRRILEKTGTVNRTELARKATREGWL